MPDSANSSIGRPNAELDEVGKIAEGNSRKSAHLYLGTHIIRGLNSTDTSLLRPVGSTGCEERVASETSPKQITAVLRKNKAICYTRKYHDNTTGISLHAIVAGEGKDAARVSGCLSLLKSLVYAQVVSLAKSYPLLRESDCLIWWYAEHVVCIRSFS